MPVSFRLPIRLNSRQILRASGGVGSSWRRALLLAVKGRLTATAIIAKSGMGRSNFFRKIGELTQPNGLVKSFKRKSGSGRRSKIPKKLLNAMKSDFEAGLDAKAIHKKLEERRVKVTIHAVGYWKRKHDYVKHRRPSKVRHRKAITRRRDILECHLDEATRQEIHKFLRENSYLRPRRILEVLLQLDKRTMDMKRTSQTSANRRPRPAREIIRKLKCSPKLLYRVAKLYRSAKNWKHFVRIAFSKNDRYNDEGSVNSLAAAQEPSPSHNDVEHFDTSFVR